MLERFRTENISSLEDILSKLVPKIDVESGDTVYPAIHLPLVFIMDNWVGVSESYSNQSIEELRGLTRNLAQGS